MKYRHLEFSAACAKPTHKELVALEELAGAPLPSDFKEFLRRANGAYLYDYDIDIIRPEGPAIVSFPTIFCTLGDGDDTVKNGIAPISGRNSPLRPRCRRLLLAYLTRGGEPSWPSRGFGQRHGGGPGSLADSFRGLCRSVTCRRWDVAETTGICWSAKTRLAQDPLEPEVRVLFSTPRVILMQPEDDLRAGDCIAGSGAGSPGSPPGISRRSR
jgi:hypothetical protein